jgi:hypothetical protein
MWIGFNWLSIDLGIINIKFWSSVIRDSHFLSRPYLSKFSSLCCETESVRTVQYAVVGYDQIVLCSSFKTIKIIFFNIGHKNLLKNQLMHLFQHFHIHIKTPERLLKMFYKSIIYK